MNPTAEDPNNNLAQSNQPSDQPTNNPGPDPVVETSSDQTTSPQPTKKVKPKALIIAVVALVLLMAVSAGAYFGIIVPNKPENQLKTALVNLSQTRQARLDGKIDFKSSKEGGQSFAVDYELKANMDTEQFGLKGDVGLNGMSFPYEIRGVEENLYFKVGGLDNLQNLIDPEADPTSSMLYAMYSNISDQWYVLDRSFMQDLGTSDECLEKVDFKINNDDANKIKKSYEKHPLFKVKASSKENLGNESVTKLEVEASEKETAKNFFNELKSLDIVKKIEKCLDDVEETTGQETKELEKAKDQKITIYITKDKKIKKIETSATEEDGTTTMTINFNYENVSVEKPSDAKPLQELFGGLFGGLDDLTVPQPEDGGDLDFNYDFDASVQ